MDRTLMCVCLGVVFLLGDPILISGVGMQKRRVCCIVGWTKV